MQPPEHRVTHRPADQGELLARVREASAELGGDQRDPLQLRHHPGLHVGDQQGLLGHGGQVYGRGAGMPSQAGRRG